jgi:predicted nuclease of predicted toxin-antitoxin system
MRLILDEGLPLRAATVLRAAGVEARHVLELGMGGASDQSVLDRARVERAVVATLDADFHRILATTGAEGPSVIRLRIEGLPSQQLADLLLNVMGRIGRQLDAGAVASVGERHIRVRRLPISG